MRLYILLLIFILTAGNTSTLFAQNETEKVIEEYTPKLQIEYVIKKTKRYAVTQRKNLDKYFIESIKYNADSKEWTIVFMGKLPIPGNHFFVVYGDRTEKMELMLGE